jgi:quinol-cytochrome oxidoreductase complex cytochrome b subunit
MGVDMDKSGFAQFADNLRALPSALRDSLVRHGRPVSDRTRSQAVFSNLFLHIHATRTHLRSLRFSATFGLGIAATSLFVILLVTGVLLMVYYKPSTSLAYESMKDIHFVVPSGRLVRNVHRWSAHLMVLVVILHMCRVFYANSYKPPREFNWIVGMGLFILTLALSFTGYLLPWDQLAYWAITIGANIAASPRELTDTLGITAQFDPGGLQKQLLLGANEVGQDALTRFYLLHVMVLPLALVALVGVHFWRIRKDGGLGRPDLAQTAAGKGVDSTQQLPLSPSSSPTKTYGLMCVVAGKTPATDLEPADTVPSWPHLLRAEAVVFMACMLVSIVLGIIADAPLKEMANPNVPENPAKAPWYFLGLQEMVSYSAFMGGLVIPAIVVVGLGLIPYLDREPGRSGMYFSSRGGARVAGRSAVFGVLAAVLAVAVPVNFGWLRNWFPDISQLWVIVINPGSLLTAAYAGWSIRTLHTTRSTRLAAIALFTCFVAGFIIMTYVGMNLRGPNWDFYWSKSAWPVH